MIRRGLDPHRRSGQHQTPAPDQLVLWPGVGHTRNFTLWTSRNVNARVQYPCMTLSSPSRKIIQQSLAGERQPLNDLKV